MTDNVFAQLRQVGEDLVGQGLTTSHGGNISVRHQGRILITTHFAMLGRLSPGDVIEIPLREEPDRIASDASRDAALHQLIYKFTPAMAVIHAHPVHAVSISLKNDIISPLDLEGSVFLRDISVVEPEDAAVRLPQLLQTRVAALVRSHGSYTVGRGLSEALAYVSALEFSCRVAILNGGRPAKEVHL